MNRNIQSKNHLFSLRGISFHLILHEWPTQKLLYVPDNSASLLLVYKQNNSTHYSLNYKLTGNRILQYESSFAEQVNDESYGLLSFGVSNLFNWQGVNVVVFNLTVDNLLDEEYISTIGYPEPGRSVNFTLEYKI